jgi:hypothetical protein
MGQLDTTARQRAGITKASKMPSLEVDWNGEVHIIAVGQFSIREKYAMRACLKGKGLPTDDEDLLAGAAIWVYLNKLDASVTLDEVLDGITVDDVAQVDADAESESSPEAFGPPSVDSGRPSLTSTASTPGTSTD